MFHHNISDRIYLQILRKGVKMIFTLPVVIAIIIAIIACFLILEPESLSKTPLEDKIMRNQFKSSKHKWQPSEQKSFYFCYLCNKLTNGLFSDILECKKCGIIIHKICRYTKLRKPDCKYIVAKNNTGIVYHQWRQASTIANAKCSICCEVCNGIENYLCLWCGRIKHGSCNGEKIACDFGPLRNFILEPTEIKCNSINFTTNAFKSLKRIKKSIKEKTSESQDNDEEEQQKIQIQCKEGKHIVVVLINKKSGGQVGNEFIKAFYRILNPLQVISILDEGLQKLKIFQDIPNLFLVIAGGDGTICSVMNFVKTIPKWAQHNPPAAILPLGTGNDLSRALGWGGSTQQEINPSELLLEYWQKGKPELLDRWKLTIVGDQNRQFTLYNYLGIGLDAKICKHFHEIREKYPHLFFSQFSNKLIYTQIGSLDIFRNKDQNLHLSNIFTLEIDGKEINIDDFENLIIMNIDHWGGGVTDLWKKTGDFKHNSYGDGLIEVIGLSDVLHMGQVQVGMDEPFQVGQGHVLTLKSKLENAILPVQIDGQPIDLVSPFKITIERKDQINILATVPTEQGKIVNFLRKAIRQELIEEHQYQSLLGLAKKMLTN